MSSVLVYLYDTPQVGRNSFDLVCHSRVLTMKEPMKFVYDLQDGIMLNTPLRILAMTALLVLAWMSY